MQVLELQKLSVATQSTEAFASLFSINCSDKGGK